MHWLGVQKTSSLICNIILTFCFFFYFCSNNKSFLRFLYAVYQAKCFTKELSHFTPQQCYEGERETVSHSVHIQVSVIPWTTLS